MKKIIYIIFTYLIASGVCFGSVTYTFLSSLDERSGTIKLSLSSFCYNEFPQPFDPLYLTLNTNNPNARLVGVDGLFGDYSTISLSPEENPTHIEIVARTSFSWCGELGNLYFSVAGSGLFSPDVALFLINNGPAMFSGPNSITYDIRPYYRLTVKKLGQGTVVSNPLGIDCGESCMSDYMEGSEITLTAAPETDHKFAGWTGACEGTSSCIIRMDSAKDVTALFIARPSSPSEVNAIAGNQKATVTWKASQGDVSEYSVTSRQVDSGVLTNQKCGTSSTTTGCEITSLENGKKYGFIVSADGPGGISDPSAESNIVIPSENRINAICGTANGVMIDTVPNSLDLCLTGYATSPTQDASKAYIWSCMGAGSGASVNCRSGGPLPVYANPTAKLNVALKTKNPQFKTGVVKSQPIGIDCGTRCGYSFTKGSRISLSVTPQDGAKFNGWSGACSHRKLTCTFKLRKNQQVTAKFK